MTRPGDRLREIAARWCNADTLARVIDPLLADLQAEHHDALARGRHWRSRWIRIAGALSFFRVLTTCALRCAVQEMTTWPQEERRALGRTIGIAFIAMAVPLTVTQIAPTWRIQQALTRHPDPLWMLYLLPQAIPVAVPFGPPFGVFMGLAGRPASYRLLTSILALALVASAISLATLTFIVPNANQAFRVAMWRAFATGSERGGVPARGPAEMTREELKDRIAWADAEGYPTTVASLTLAYHRRVSLPFAPLALALFAVAARPRRTKRAVLLVTAALGTCLAYFGLVGVGESLSETERIPGFLGAWLPNLVFVSLAGILLLRSAVSSRVKYEAADA